MLYNATLVFAVQHNESAIHIHMSLPFWTSFQFTSPQCLKYSCRCWAIYYHYLSIICIISIVCMCQSQCPYFSHLPFTMVYIYLFFTYVSLSALQISLYFFRFHVYALKYNICFSLSDFILYVTL